MFFGNNGNFDKCIYKNTNQVSQQQYISKKKKNLLRVDVFSVRTEEVFASYPVLSTDWYEEQDDKYSAASRIYFPLEPAFEV